MLAAELFEFRVDHAFTGGVPQHRGSDKEETCKLVMDTAFDVSVHERHKKFQQGETYSWTWPSTFIFLNTAGNSNKESTLECKMQWAALLGAFVPTLECKMQ